MTQGEWDGVSSGNAYEVLGVDPNETLDDAKVKAAYEKRVASAADEQVQRIDEAYETLSSEEGRAGYRAALDMASGKSASRGKSGGTRASLRRSKSVRESVSFGGISQMLFGERAAYGKLLEASLKARGSFSLMLPQLVVCGMENEGKSSVLERIAMREMFPRDKRFCTRMPIRLMLRCCKHQNQVTIRLKNTTTGQISGEAKTFACKTGDQSDEPFSSLVAQCIKDFISEVHPGDKGDNVVVDEEIQVEIRAPCVPTIDLIDLPGIVQSPKEAQRDTAAITQRMLKVPHTLVVAVVSGRSQSLRNNGIWSFLREAGTPAVVVLTMIDKPGGDEDLKERLEGGNHEIPTDAGVTVTIPVVNRDTTQRRDPISLAQSFDHERDVLRSVCKDNGIAFDSKKHGMAAVLGAINEMLNAYMRDVWVEQETDRACIELHHNLTKLWDLGMKPAAVGIEEIESELNARLTIFRSLPTADVVNLESLSLDFVLPNDSPILMRLELSSDLEDKLEADLHKIISSLWRRLRSLAVRKLMTESRPPINIGRLSQVSESINCALDNVWEDARPKIVAYVMKKARRVISEALEQLDKDVIKSTKLLTELKSLIVLAVLKHTLGGRSELVGEAVELIKSSCAGGFTETEVAAEERNRLETAIEALYCTKAILDSLTDSSTTKGNTAFDEARCFLDGGPTAKTPSPRTIDSNLMELAPTQYLQPIFAGAISEVVRQHNKPDSRVLAALIRCRPDAIPYVIHGRRCTDRKVALAIVEKDGMQLGQTCAAFKDDVIVAVAAVRQNRQAFRYVSLRLLSDKDVMDVAKETSQTELASMCQSRPEFFGLMPENLQLVALPALSESEWIVALGKSKSLKVLQAACAAVKASSPNYYDTGVVGAIAVAMAVYPSDLQLQRVACQAIEVRAGAMYSYGQQLSNEAVEAVIVAAAEHSNDAALQQAACAVLHSYAQNSRSFPYHHARAPDMVGRAIRVLEAAATTHRSCSQVARSAVGLLKQGNY